MQAVYRDTQIAPTPHFNRTPPPAFKPSHAERFGEMIYLVDDDACVRDEISAFLTEFQMKVVGFASATDCLDFCGGDAAACVILNTHLPDISGLELHRRLQERANPSVIFISDRCDIASTVSAMKAGAIEFLTKPVDLGALLAAVRAAVARDRMLRQKKADLAKLQARLSILTPRERQVLPLIVGGLLNKQAASVLGISEVTLQIHRSQVMRKMQAESFAELVRMAVKLRIPYWSEGQSSHDQQQRAFPSAARSRTGGVVLNRS